MHTQDTSLSNGIPSQTGLVNQESNDATSMPLWKQLLKVWKTAVIILTPIVLLPLPLLWTEKAGRCAYVVAIMAIYWMTEAIPIAATALLPFALMPWLGIIKSSEVAVNYLKDTNFLFVGGLMVALAIEKCNLHKRMALRVLLLVGSRPRWLIFGFMITTAFLSMWLSNTATTAMMVPIAQAVLMELKQHTQRVESSTDMQMTDMELEQHTQRGESSTDMQMTDIEAVHGNEIDNDNNNDRKGFPNDPDGKKTRQFINLCKGLTLSICYAANIGGICTLTGTGPNLIVKGQLDVLFGSSHGINFTSWMAFAFPIGLMSLLLAWLWLNILFLGPKSFFRRSGEDISEDTVGKVIRKQYKALGAMSFGEIWVLVFFIILALLWLTKDPEFIDGWSVLFEDSYVSDACVGVTVSVLLFMWPADRPTIVPFRKASEERPPGAVGSLLDWKYVNDNMAWSVVIVLGGGFALADAVKKSGLSADIGDAFRSFEDFDPMVLVLVLSIITAGFTEIASNTATATIFLPILAELAKVLKVNPLYLMLPTAVSTSFAFMLPVATPPNAIVFAYGHMKIIDMVKAGIVLNVICIGVLTLGVNTWGYAYFDLGTLPHWAIDAGANDN